MKTQTAKTNGFTIIELLIGLLLCSITLVTITQLTHSNSSLYKRQLENYREATVSAQLQELLNDSLVETTSYDFLAQFIIQSPGSIRDIYGHVIAGLHIEPHSTPLTVITPNSNFIVTKETGNVAPQNFCLVPLTSDTTLAKSQASKTTHWILISVDGYFQALSSTQRIKGNSHCGSSIGMELRLVAENEEMFGAAFQTNYRPFALIPVDTCYSIYLDNKKTLRRISHITKESQPIMKNIQAMTFSLSESQDALLTSMAIENNRELTMATYLPDNPAAKGHYLDLLF